MQYRIYLALLMVTATSIQSCRSSSPSAQLKEETWRGFSFDDLTVRIQTKDHHPIDQVPIYYKLDTTDAGQEEVSSGHATKSGDRLLGKTGPTDGVQLRGLERGVFRKEHFDLNVGWLQRPKSLKIWAESQFRIGCTDTQYVDYRSEPPVLRFERTKAIKIGKLRAIHKSVSADHENCSLKIEHQGDTSRRLKLSCIADITRAEYLSLVNAPCGK